MLNFCCRIYLKIALHEMCINDAENPIICFPFQASQVLSKLCISIKIVKTEIHLGEFLESKQSFGISYLNTYAVETLIKRSIKLVLHEKPVLSLEVNYNERYPLFFGGYGYRILRFRHRDLFTFVYFLHCKYA